MKIHHIKCAVAFFTDVAANVKRAEMRINDRDYKVGDILALNEWAGGFTGKRCYRAVTHMLTAETFPTAICEGWALLSIRPLTNLEKETMKTSSHEVKL